MRKILNILLFLALLSPVVPIQSVNAGNTTDETYNYSIPSTGSSVFSYARAKYDDTSVYVKPQTMGGSLSSVYIKIYGVSDYNFTSYSDCTWRGRNYYYNSNCLNSAFEVYNSVYGNYNFAALCMRTGGGAGTTSGLWSPDTAGHFQQMPY